MWPLLLLLAAFDGEAALKHAASLAALGPHPWGSPRGRAAAEYVGIQFRQAGLEEVRLQEYVAEGNRHGANVIGVLRAPGPEFVVLAAHHDSVPEGPGAYDDGGGVGVLIETARVLAQEKTRPRTLVFVSFDGEESESVQDGVLPTGSAFYVQSLLKERDHLVAALVVEMCGFPGGTPVLHPIAYADPLRPGNYTITPTWLMRAALDGAKQGGSGFPVGDPYLSWLYQPLVRTYRTNFYGDDLSFLRANLPAVFVSDSNFSQFYPWYHTSGDTADKIDAPSLARMGRGVVGMAHALSRATRAEAEQSWFSAFGAVAPLAALWLAGVGSLIPGLLRAFRTGGRMLAVRVLEAVLFGVLMVRNPVPAVWSLAAPQLAFGPLWVRALALLPVLSLQGLGLLAAQRGMTSGTWLAPWEIGVFLAALALLWIPEPAGPSGARTRKRAQARAPRSRSRAA